MSIFPTLLASLLLSPAPPQDESPAIVAHRGASSRAPENTLAAFRLGFDHGADAVEGDFRLTRDGVVVAMHDETLRRTTGDPRAVATVLRSDLSDLSVGDWGAWKGTGFQEERVPTLSQVFAIVPDGRGIFVELKGGVDMVEPTLLAIERSGISSDRITIIAFDADVVAAIKRCAPEQRALWLTSFRRRGSSWSPDAREVVETAMRIGADGVDVKADRLVVDEAFVEIVRAAGLELHVWTVNDPVLAGRMVGLGVDSITTDEPRSIRSTLDSRSTTER